MKAHANNGRQQANRPSEPNASAALQLRPSLLPMSNERPQSQQLNALQAMMNGAAHVRQLRSLHSVVNGGRGIVQRMPAEEIKTGKYYDIQGIDGPRYLEAAIPADQGGPRWRFRSDPVGGAPDEAALLVDDPDRILRMVAPAEGAEEWGAADNKIFGLDGKNMEAVRKAIETGYRAFDAAKTYGFTAAHLVKACTDAGLARQDYKVVYKVGHGTTQDSLAAVINEALSALGYIDILMVHESTASLAGNIATINKYIESGRVKAGGLSNVAAADLEGMDETDLRHVVALQDSTETIRAERQTGAELRAKGKLEGYGNKVMQSVYGLQSGISFNAEETRTLDELNVSAAQARMIWAAHQGLGEVASSANPQRIEQNFQTPQVSAEVAQAVVALVEENLNRPAGAAEGDDLEGWNAKPLAEIHQAAINNAQSNDLGMFITRLKDIIQNTKGLGPGLRKMLPLRLRLRSANVATDRIYQEITWQKLLTGDQNVLAACNKKDLLLAIAAAVKEIDERL